MPDCFQMAIRTNIPGPFLIPWEPDIDGEKSAHADLPRLAIGPSGRAEVGFVLFELEEDAECEMNSGSSWAQLRHGRPTTQVS